MWSTSGQPYLPGSPPRAVRYASRSRSLPRDARPAVQDAPPRGGDGAHPPARAEQRAGDRRDGVGVVADPDRGGRARRRGGGTPGRRSGTGVWVIADHAACSAPTDQPFCANERGGLRLRLGEDVAPAGPALGTHASMSSNVGNSPCSTACRIIRHHTAHASCAWSSWWVSALTAIAASTRPSGSSR